MAELRDDAVTPSGLITADTTKLWAKVAEFAAAGAAGMHAVFDFDRTLTVKKPGTQDEVTSWHILRAHLPDEGQLEYQRLFDRYRPLELSGDMTLKEAGDWPSAILDLFVKYKVDFTDVEETFLDRANVRPGTVELFKLLADNDIPTVVLSAGIRNVIDIWCRKYDINPSLIVSTALILDNDNNVAGWQKETLVHVLNKSEATHSELYAIRSSRPNALLVGDGLDDANMVAGDGNAIRVRVIDPRADESDTKQEEVRTFKRFDALIRSESLYPLCGLLETILITAQV